MELCRAKRHQMVGNNVIMTKKGRRCRACFNEAQRRLRRERSLKTGVGFAEPIEDLDPNQLLSRYYQVESQIRAAESALELAHKAEQRLKGRLKTAESKTQRAQETLEAAVRLKEKIDRLRQQKIEESGSNAYF
jgi:hypothetical protein